MDEIDANETRISLNASSGTRSSFNAGAVIANKYKVVRELGRGGMGIVLEVENVFLSKKFALKLLDMREAPPAAVARFQREAKMLGSLEHPNIVKAFDFGLLDESTPYVLMELVQGQTISEHIRSNGCLTETGLVQVFIPVLEALRYAHERGVIHRDVKPGNIMLTRAGGDEPIPKLLDFGIAGYLEAAKEALTRTGELIGTPLYMSPEQVSGRAIGASSDIYSLGCVMFEALTGAPPLRGRTALETMMQHKTEVAPSLREASLGKHYSASIERVIAKMLTKETAARYQTCDQVISDLLHPAGSKPAVVSNRHDQLATNDRKKIYVAIGVTTLCLSVGGVALWLNNLNHKDSSLIAQPSKTPSDTMRESAKSEKLNNSLAPHTMIANAKEEESDGLSEALGSTTLGSFTMSEVKTDQGRRFEFEGPKTAGKLLWCTAGEAVISPMKGRVDVPLSAELWLSPRRAMYANPQYISEFRGTDLSGLLILSEEMADQSRFPRSILVCLTLLPQAPALAISKIAIGPSVLEGIAGMTHLRWLSISTSSSAQILESQAIKLAKLPVVQSLETLGIRFENSNSAKPFLKQLTEHPNHKLKRLGVIKCQLDQADFENISKLSSLNYLNVCDSFRQPPPARAKALATILKLPRLKTLAMSAEYLDLAMAKQLIQSKSLRLLIFQNPEHLKPDAEEILLKSPHCKIIKTSNAAFGFEPWKESFKLP